MTPDVRHARNFQEFLTPKGCWILEVANDEDDPAASIARARVPPGVTTELHRLAGVIERYVIVSGTGRVELTPANAEDVEPGDVVRIPAGVGQRITNTGANDLVFFCVCTPRFSPASYERIEKEYDEDGDSMSTASELSPRMSLEIASRVRFNNLWWTGRTG